MEFEQFSRARDLLYLAALFLGAGAGCILNRWRKNISARSKSASVTAALCFFSGTFAALTLAIIVSNWLIFFETSLYAPLCASVFITLLVFRFPRAAGFPLVIAAGVFAVWMGYVCNCYPPVSEADQVRLYRDGDGLVRVARAVSPESSPTATVFYESAERITALEVRARFFSFVKNFPLAGGVERGNITEIRANDKPLYAAPRPLLFTSPASGSPAKGLFFSYWDTAVPLSPEDIPSGSGLSVLPEDSVLVVR